MSRLLTRNSSQLFVAIVFWVAFSSELLADENNSVSFVAEHCVRCHDADTKKGNLDLTILKPTFGDATQFAEWVKAFDRTNNYPLPNLFVSVLQRLGIEVDKFASSTGTLRGLEQV